MASVGDLSRAWVAFTDVPGFFKDTLNYRFKGGELNGWTVRNIIWIACLLKYHKNKLPLTKDEGWKNAIKEMNLIMNWSRRKKC